MACKEKEMKEINGAAEEHSSAESLPISPPEKPPPRCVEETTESQISSPLAVQLLLSPQPASSVSVISCHTVTTAPAHLHPNSSTQN